MKILMIPSWYPTATDKLWGGYFIEQAKALSSFADVSMLHINRVGLKQFFSLSKIKKGDGFSETRHPFPFYEKTVLDIRSVSRMLAYKRYAEAGVVAYEKLVEKTGKPDVILVESSLPAGLAALAIKQRRGVPYVVHEHSYDVLVNPAYSEMSAAVVRGSSLNMAVYQKIADKISEITGRSCETVPNYIDAARFDIPKNSADGCFTLLSISNFYKVKAIDMLLDALDIVVHREKIQDVRLKIVGSGAYKDYYMRYAEKLSLGSFVEFAGYIPNTDIPQVYASCDALCVSSEIETFCIPIVEALASGMPVIATRCGGPNSLVTEQNGILTDVGDPEMFARAIIRLKQTAASYSPQAIKKAALIYDKSAVCGRIISLLQPICKTQ